MSAIVPQNIKNCTSLSSFKINIGNIKPKYQVLYKNFESNKKTYRK